MVRIVFQCGLFVYAECVSVCVCVCVCVLHECGELCEC